MKRVVEFVVKDVLLTEVKSQYPHMEEVAQFLASLTSELRSCVSNTGFLSLWLSLLLLNLRMLQAVAKGSDMKGNLRSKIWKSELMQRCEEEKNSTSLHVSVHLMSACFLSSSNSQERENTLKRTWNKWRTKWNRYISLKYLEKAVSNPSHLVGLRLT